MLRCCAEAKAQGLSVERIAVLDNADETTERAVRTYESEFDIVLPVDVRDLGASRNAARAVSSGDFLTFFDGDDLWGDGWIWRCHSFLETQDINNTIVHPQAIYYFSADDYLHQSHDETFPSTAKSLYLLHQDSTHPNFDPRAILLDNLWTANTFAHRDLFKRFPYETVDHDRGYGVEDWLWNAQTLAAEVKHAVAPDTVHCVRLKRTGSLSAKNYSSGLLPPLHRFAEQLECIWGRKCR